MDIFLNEIESLGNLSNLQKDNNTEEKNKNFGQMLMETLNNVNKLQVDADEIATDFVTGEVDDVHKVMIAAEEAKLSLQLMVQVRNKAVEAYEEISRMQI